MRHTVTRGNRVGRRVVLSGIMGYLLLQSQGCGNSGSFAATVARLDIDAAQRRALLDRDHAALNDLLGGRATMFFGLVPAENDDEPQPADGEEPTPEQSPDTDRAD